MFVIPAAGGAALAVLGEIAIEIAILAGFLLAISLVVWLLFNAQRAARALPFVGGQIAGVIGNVTNATIAIGTVFEPAIRIQLFYLHHAIRVLLHLFLAPVLLPIYHTLETLGNVAGYVIQVWIPYASALFIDVFGRIRVLADFAGWVHEVEIPRIWGSIIVAYARIADILGWIDVVGSVTFPNIFGAINQLRADLVLTITAVRELQQFLPVLRSLAEFEATAERGLGGLRVDVDELSNIAKWLRRDIDKVLPLSVVTALGLAAVMNLERLARDPCYCLKAGDLSDLPSRVEALEELGP